MKKSRLMICATIALVVISAFSGIAFAGNAGPAYWNSTVCHSAFTTSQSVSKVDDSTWIGFVVSANEITYEPSGAYLHRLRAQPVTTSGNIMGAKTEIKENEPWPIDCTSNSGTRTNKLRIFNYYPTGLNPNMKSNGDWHGTWEWNE